MKKIAMILVLAMVILSGCMASFPAKYEPKFNVEPNFGNKEFVYADTKFLTAFKSESKDDSLKLQTLVDKKIEQWGYRRELDGKKLTITVQNKIRNVGTMVLTSILCGLTLYLIPSVAEDGYVLTATLSQQGKPDREFKYETYITSYQEIVFIFWGIFAYPPKTAVWTSVENMVDNLLYDIKQEN